MIERDYEDGVFRVECDDCPFAQEIYSITGGWSLMIVILRSKSWELITIAGGSEFKTVCPECSKAMARQ